MSCRELLLFPLLKPRPLSVQKYPRSFIYGGVIRLKTLYYFLASSLGISSPPNPQLQELSWMGQK